MIGSTGWRNLIGRGLAARAPHRTAQEFRLLMFADDRCCRCRPARRTRCADRRFLAHNRCWLGCYRRLERRLAGRCVLTNVSTVARPAVAKPRIPRLSVALLRLALSAAVVLIAIAALAAVEALTAAAIVTVVEALAPVCAIAFARLETVALLAPLLIVEARLAVIEAIAVAIPITISLAIAFSALTFLPYSFEYSRLLIVTAGLRRFHWRKRLHIAPVALDLILARVLALFRCLARLSLALTPAAVRPVFALR